MTGQEWCKRQIWLFLGCCSDGSGVLMGLQEAAHEAECRFKVKLSTGQRRARYQISMLTLILPILSLQVNLGGQSADKRRKTFFVQSTHCSRVPVTLPHCDPIRPCADTTQNPFPSLRTLGLLQALLQVTLDSLLNLPGAAEPVS